jgi:hypothetical protein
MILFAAESLFTTSHILELAVVLTIATAGLWYSTAQVHKDEVIKMTDAATHANDNITQVALAEIDSHNKDRMKVIRHKAKGRIAQ